MATAFRQGWCPYQPWRKALDNKYQFKGKFKVEFLNVSIFRIRRNP